MQDETGPPLQKRLRILDDAEIAALYGRPCFTSEERTQFFTLTQPERELLHLLRSIPSQTYFILQLGYFKAKALFFSFRFAEVADDVAFILAQYFPQAPEVDWEPLGKQTIFKQREFILTLFRYRLCQAAERQHLLLRAQQAAQISSKPIYVFRELVQYLTEQRIVAPGYTTLQDIVGQALTYEQQRLTTIIRAALMPDERATLDRLFEDTDGLYAITLLKREPKDFSLREMRQEIGRAADLRPLYHLATRIVPQLAISNEGIKYYASLVAYYSAFRLRQLEPWTVYLYLLCFVMHRYQRLHDHLLACFIHLVKQYGDAAKVAAKEQVYAQRLERTDDLAKAGAILHLFTTDPDDPTTPFQIVQAQAFGILDRDRLARVADYLATKASIDEIALQWAQIDTLAHRFKRHLRPILLTVELAATRTNAPLLDAIAVLKTAFREARPLSQVAHDALPSRCIPVRLKRYLYEQDAAGGKRLIPDRYEFLVYRLIRNGLESGDLYCRDSVRFRSFEDDLLGDRDWQAKATLIANAGLSILVQPIHEHLAALERHLEDRIVAVNQRIADGDNAHFHIKHHGHRLRWTLRYPQGSEPVNHPVFDTLRQVDISSVLAFVHQACNFLTTFDHVLGRYRKQAVDDHVISACLVAWGTNMGLGRMGDISDISYHTLVRISENFLRPETLKAANDCVSNAIAALPLLRHYDLGEVVHSSSDGQKFEAALPTINARHSPKYFGLKKGVVAYTLVANHIPVNARIIGAHEHESHFVFDLLFNNTTEIQPEVHSTDTHGTNEVNFALLHVFGYQFAPRYQALQEKVRTALYGFRHPRHYGDLILKPIRKIQTDLIIEEWDNLQRIFVSLARKTTTQSIIVGKLSAYTRRNKTRRALWEYDNILRSLYLLEYIDSSPLRQNVQRALNRGEQYHQLRRAVSYANFGKLRFKTEEEQQLWSECSRLLTNCIIYYNMTILSRVLAHKEATGDLVGAALLMQVSPVAWQHINLYGRYEFTKGPAPINLETIVAELAQRPIATSGDELEDHHGTII